MNNLIISAESTCDLTEEIIKKYNIKIAPTEYFVDGYSYNTQTNHLQAKELYGKMRKGADTKTTQVNYQNAYNFLEGLLKTKKDVLHISFSSGLSGTFENFKLASEELNKKYDNKCIVIDSLCASAGQGLLVMLTAKKAKEKDITLHNLLEYVNDLKLKINHIFTVDDLKYLVKGGRVGKASAKMASILHIKPLMNVDIYGKLNVTNKVFSRKITIKKMFEKMMANYDLHFADIFICEADCKKDADTLAEMIKKHYGIESIIVPLDYLIGCHSGPGTLALFYVGDKR